MRAAAVIHRQWPWSFEAGLRWILSSVLSLVLIATAWFVVGGEGDLAAQVPLLAGAIVALMVGCYGHVVMVARGRRSIGQRRRRLLDDGLLALNVDGVPRGAPAGAMLEALDGLPHFHDPACQMLVDRPIESIFVGTAADHQHDGRVPCGICRPVGPAEPGEATGEGRA